MLQRMNYDFVQQTAVECAIHGLSAFGHDARRGTGNGAAEDFRKFQFGKTAGRRQSFQSFSGCQCLTAFHHFCTDFDGMDPHGMAIFYGLLLIDCSCKMPHRFPEATLP